MDYRPRREWRGTPLLTPELFEEARIEKEIRAIDPSLKLRFTEKDGKRCPIVFQEIRAPNGKVVKDQLVGFYDVADQRIVRRMEEIRPGGRGKYNLSQELERSEARSDRSSRHGTAEVIGEMAQEMELPVKRYLGIKDRIYV